MKSIESSAQSLRDERIPRKMPCFVVWKGRTVRRVTIENVSRKGLLLRGSAALYLDVCAGDKLLVYTRLGEDKIGLEGIVCRSAHGADQLIALRDVTWYDGWPSAPSDEEQAAEGSDDPVSTDQVVDGPGPASPKAEL
jgi:hypothetical protein